MDINVTLKIESPEIMASILALAESLTEMKLKVRHYWEEDSNKNLGKTLNKCYEKDNCLFNVEKNTAIENEEKQINKLKTINNADSTPHLSNMGTGISENSTGEEVTEHREENIKESTTEDIKFNNRQITFEELKGKLVALSKGGKHKEVKDLLNKYGFSKITEISSQHYEAIFREAERF